MSSHEERCPLCGGLVHARWDETHHTTCLNCGARIGTTTRHPRKCKHHGCITRLSARNPGPFCLVHTPDLVELPTLARIRPRVWSERFQRGYAEAYELTPEERARYARGDW